MIGGEEGTFPAARGGFETGGCRGVPCRPGFAPLTPFITPGAARPHPAWNRNRSQSAWEDPQWPEP